MDDALNQSPLFSTVCGGKIENPDLYPSAEYKGRRVYFCNNGCLRAFEVDPDGFIEGKVEHPVDQVNEI